MDVDQSSICFSSDLLLDEDPKPGFNFSTKRVLHGTRQLKHTSHLFLKLAEAERQYGLEVEKAAREYEGKLKKWATRVEGPGVPHRPQGN
mmetsp:Transcript_16863/g.42327  ORF Transcript_16863/g.42327 Transcript_16863/m.42327 type:complete len:90 (-) Transcript_16863:7-276(-)